MNALGVHVLFFLFCCGSVSAFSTYLVEERAEICFFRVAEERTKFHAKVGASLVLSPLRLDFKSTPDKQLLPFYCHQPTCPRFDPVIISGVRLSRGDEA